MVRSSPPSPLTRSRVILDFASRIKKMAMPPLSDALPWPLHPPLPLPLRLVPPSLDGITTSSSASGARTPAPASSATSTPPLSAASDSASSSTTSSGGGRRSPSRSSGPSSAPGSPSSSSPPNFPASTWCLQELAKILEMQDSRGQLVRPVFFHVDPSDVRKQTGVFAAIMAKHEEVFGGDGSERVKKWRDALRKAVNLSGWHLGHGNHPPTRDYQLISFGLAHYAKGKRSRLWYHEDIRRVFRENSGTNSVEGIKLDMFEPEEVFMGTKAIKQMKRLRLILVRNIHTYGCPEYLSNEIRWLDVHGNNLPATAESYGPAKLSIHDSSPTQPAKNGKHHGQIGKIMFRFRCKGAASRNCKINCRDALPDFKCIVATPPKLSQFLCFKRRKGHTHKHGEADSESASADSESDMPLQVFEKFSKAELVHATNNFSDDNKIGVGSTGSVYHGILDDGREVAIKWTNLTRKGFEDGTFIAEIKTLCHVNHKNLVRMLGFHARRSEHALVYEYMNNGSLFYHRHTFSTSALMSWTTQIKVALHVARGMEYLHEFACPRIVHGDLKSANILLDKSWTAKVSDFGSSKLLPENEVSDSGHFFGGTVGYLAPEYISSNRLTTKSDVYSYGIVLLELLSGRKALQRDEDGPLSHITMVVVPCIEEDKICQALDQNVPIPAPFKMIAVEDMAYLAVDCVRTEAENRPPMTYVVDSLRSALAKCSPACL
ncbi:hypothetical protein NL676_023647 [Syzygium grande]|nr:hypothetical protein NL676_023647 [Syzygium grande]